MNLYLWSQLAGYASTALTLLAAQQKKMTTVLILAIIYNTLSALSNFLVGGIVGSVLCLVAVGQTLISSLYEKKSRRVPLWITALFMAAYIACTALTFSGWLDLLPCVGALAYAVAVLQTKTSGYRLCMIVNAGVWMIYELTLTPPNYAIALSGALTLVSIFIGMLRLDRKKN